MSATRLNPTALDAESVHTVLQQRCKQPLQLRSATIQVVDIHHDQNIYPTVCSGVKQVHYTGTQHKRLFFGSCLRVQLLYARPAQFAQSFTADQNLLPHGEIAALDFLNETNRPHENQPP